MRPLRKCNSGLLNTGVSKCAPDFGKTMAAIIVSSGTKLPAVLNKETFEQLIHADVPERIYGIKTFAESNPSGGEAQTADNGYLGSQVTGYSAWTEVFTMNKYYPELHASLIGFLNVECGVYFIDEDRRLHGVNDGTEVLAPYTMSSIYSNVVARGTSSANPSQTISFVHKDTKKDYIDYDYVDLDFDILASDISFGLTEVKLVKVSDEGSDYKLLEKRGGNDVTGIYGPLIATAGKTVLTGDVTAVAYQEETATLTITGTDVALAAPKILEQEGIKGIIGV